MSEFQSIGAIAAKVVDRWAWWTRALANPDEIGKSLVVTTSPEQGYFRTRTKGGQWEPIALFYPEGSDQLVAYRNGREVRADDDLWTRCCRHPISYEAYTKAMEGGGFDDEPPAPIGDNSGEADPFEALRIELAGEAEQLAEFLKVNVQSQADADRIGIWAKRLGDLAKRADGEREHEKAPHLQACRDVDDRWRGIIADAKEWATKAKRHVEAFLIARKREEEAKARAAREEAERQRRAAQDAQDEQQRIAALKAAEEAERASGARNASAGRTGARVSVRVEKRGEIVDYDALLVALKDRAEIRELVQSLANRAAKSGFELAGMKIVEVEKIA